MINVAVFLADGFEEIEGLTPVDYLRRAGANVTTIGVKGKTYNNTMIVTSSHNIQIICDTTLKDYLSLNTMPDCLVCPGGSIGAENLSNTLELINYLEKANEQKKLIAAICAAPAVVLGKTNILQNKKWTCYPTCKDFAKKEYVQNYIDQVFVTQDNLVTSKGPGASEQFAMELVRILFGKDVAKKISEASMQRTGQ